jgi:hypothetical protein
MTENVAGIVIPRLAATALSLGLAVWALNGIADLSETKVLRSLASAIESGEEPRSDVLDRLDKTGVPNRVLANCDRSDLRALAAVRLKELDLAFVAADPPKADRAFEGAEAAIRKSLSCAPLDGNFWLRLATVDTARRGTSPATFQFVRLSHWTTPSEGWIVRSRVDFAARLFDAGLTDIQSELRSDIRTLVGFDTVNNVAEMYVAAPESVRPIYREWIGLLPESRKRRVTRAVEGRGGKLNDT